MIIIGYPWLIPAASTCEPSVPIALGDVPYLRNLQATLNDAIREAAADTDTTFLDMSVASRGTTPASPSECGGWNHCCSRISSCRCTRTHLVRPPSRLM